MKQKTLHHPRRISFEIAKRYLRRYTNVFMSCAHGYGWILYRYYLEKPNSVGKEGWKSAFVAYVDNVPEGVISGNYWTNP